MNSCSPSFFAGRLNRRLENGVFPQIVLDPASYINYRSKLMVSVNNLVSNDVSHPNPVPDTLRSVDSEKLMTGEQCEVTTDSSNIIPGASIRQTRRIEHHAEDHFIDLDYQQEQEHQDYCDQVCT